MIWGEKLHCCAPPVQLLLPHLGWRLELLSVYAYPVFKCKRRESQPRAMPLYADQPLGLHANLSAQAMFEIQVSVITAQG